MKTTEKKERENINVIYSYALAISCAKNHYE